MKKLILATLLAIAGASSAVQADVYVHGYTRSDGTYVAPHYRSSPNSSTYDNWSTRGNVNPYTGKIGTRSPEPSYGGGYSSPRTYSPSPYGYGNRPNTLGQPTRPLGEAPSTLGW